MTKLQANTFLNHAAQWLVGPSIVLNLFFLTGFYQTVSSLPALIQENENIDKLRHEKIDNRLKGIDNELADNQQLWLDQHDWNGSAENLLYRVQFRLKMTPDSK